MDGYDLIVHNPFGPYGKGAHIRDAAEVQAVLTGPSVANVLRIAPVGELPAAAPAVEGAPA